MTSRRRATQEIHRERYPATHCLHLHDLPGRDLRLRLPVRPQPGRRAGRHPSRLRLRRPVSVRPELHLRQALIRAVPKAVPAAGGNPPPAPDGLGLPFNVRESPMNTFALAFLGGIFGAVLMDITETAMARVGIRSGVNVALVGRWLLGLMQGRLAHADIQASPSLPREVGLGWAFHLLVGGGGVALIYPAVLLAMAAPPTAHPLLDGLLFGLATSLLPWFVLLPAFGWGWFGRSGPRGADALLASPLSHIPYGLGVGAVMALGSGFP
jgi:hypothetical protein